MYFNPNTHVHSFNLLTSSVWKSTLSTKNTLWVPLSRKKKEKSVEKFAHLRPRTFFTSWAVSFHVNGAIPVDPQNSLTYEEHLFILNRIKLSEFYLYKSFHVQKGGHLRKSRKFISYTPVNSAWKVTNKRSDVFVQLQAAKSIELALQNRFFKLQSDFSGQ